MTSTEIKILTRLEKKVDRLEKLLKGEPKRKRLPDPNRKLKNKILGNRTPSKAEFYERIDRRILNRA